MEDTRYPYTYAADHLRAVAGYVDDNTYLSTKLSRSDASRIRQEIADILGMDDEELAKKIADRFISSSSEREKKLEGILKKIDIAPSPPEMEFWDAFRQCFYDKNRRMQRVDRVAGPYSFDQNEWWVDANGQATPFREADFELKWTVQDEDNYYTATGEKWDGK